MLIKEPLFKGLDVRTNPLVIDPARCSDCDNVYLDDSDTLINRPYMGEFSFDVGVLPGKIKGFQTATFRSYADAELRYKRYLLAYVEGSAVAAGKVLRVNSAPFAGTTFDEDGILEAAAGANFQTVRTRMSLTSMPDGAPFVKGNPVKGVMFGDVMYFAGISGLWKYDGLQVMRAGLPFCAMALTNVSGSVLARYIRNFIAFYDFSGQWVFGDYETFFNAGVNTNFKVNYSPTSTSAGGYLFREGADPYNDRDMSLGRWDNGYAILSGYGANVGGNKYAYAYTFTTLVVGDFLTVYLGDVVYKLYVSALTGSDITFDGDQSYFKDLNTSGPFTRGSIAVIDTLYDGANVLYSSLQHIIYVSSAETSGFQYVGKQNLAVDAHCTGFGPTFVATYPSAVVPPVAYPFSHEFEACYDESKIKGLLPHNGTTAQTDIRFLALYNNVLLAADSQYIYYCDLSIGSTVENFDPLDFFTAGTPEDGPITGIYATDEYVIVHRELNSFYVSGNITSGNFRTNSLNTPKLGALGHWAQASVQAQDFFISKKGAHTISRGGNIKDAGELLVPAFKNKLGSQFGLFPRDIAELPLANCIDDEQKDHIYVFYQGNDGSDFTKVLVFNYRNGEWFKWKMPVAFQKVSTSVHGGAAALEGVLWTSNGETVFIEGAATPDDAYTEAFFLSVFRDMAIPSLEKKFTYLKVFSLFNTDPWELDVKVRYDWESSSMLDQAALTLPNDEENVNPAQGFNLTDLEARRCYSLQIRLASETHFKLQGYELNGDLQQEEIKR